MCVGVCVSVWFISCFVFSELPGSVVLCLSLSWKHFQSLLFKICLLLHSVFSVSYCSYVNVTYFEVMLQFLNVFSFFFKFYFPLCILVWEISVGLYSCSSVVSGLLKNTLRPLFQLYLFYF